MIMISILTINPENGNQQQARARLEPAWQSLLAATRLQYKV